MPKTEQQFENFLISQGYKEHCDYEKQYVITNCPFTDSGKHKVDFYLKKKNLCIEVKGFMTLYAINVLKYLQSRSDINLYILGATHEDWVSPYNKVQHRSITNKIQSDVKLQYDEIISKSTKELVKISGDRLDNYVKLMNNMYKSWINP